MEEVALHLALMHNVSSQGEVLLVKGIAFTETYSVYRIGRWLVVDRTRI